MVVVSGGQAMSFLIPAAPASTRFVRVDSNLFYLGFESLEDRYDNALGRRIAALIAAHEGEFFALFSEGEQAFADSDLAFFGLRRERGSCRPVASKGGPPLLLCRVVRARLSSAGPGAAPAGPPPRTAPSPPGPPA